MVSLSSFDKLRMIMVSLSSFDKLRMIMVSLSSFDRLRMIMVSLWNHPATVIRKSVPLTFYVKTQNGCVQAFALPQPRHTART